MQANVSLIIFIMMYIKKNAYQFPHPRGTSSREPCHFSVGFRTRYTKVHTGPL